MQKETRDKIRNLILELRQTNDPEEQHRIKMEIDELEDTLTRF